MLVGGGVDGGVGGHARGGVRGLCAGGWRRHWRCECEAHVRTGGEGSESSDWEGVKGSVIACEVEGHAPKSSYFDNR